MTRKKTCTDTICAVKRRFLRQNRELAKYVSRQGMALFGSLR